MPPPSSTFLHPHPSPLPPDATPLPSHVPPGPTTSSIGRVNKKTAITAQIRPPAARSVVPAHSVAPCHRIRLPTRRHLRHPSDGEEKKPNGTHSSSCHFILATLPPPPSSISPLSPFFLNPLASPSPPPAWFTAPKTMWFCRRSSSLFLLLLVHRSPLRVCVQCATTQEEAPVAKFGQGAAQSACASKQCAAPRVQLGLCEELAVQPGLDEELDVQSACLFLCSACHRHPLNFYLFPAFIVP